jgi:hypothetical protein
MRVSQQLREALVKAGWKMSPEARRTEIELTRKYKEEKARNKSTNNQGDKR